jgi:hypothetical protein
LIFFRRKEGKNNNFRKNREEQWNWTVQSSFYLGLLIFVSILYLDWCQL